MFKIRSPQPADYEKLKELFKDNSVLKPDFINKLVYSMQDFIPYNFRYLPSIHVAIEEKNILGYIILQSLSKPNNCWQINEVFVQDEVRNKGIGEELLRYVLSLYGGHGVEHFLAEIDSQNFPALSLFHECGFRRYTKVGFYEKEINVKEFSNVPLLDNDFIIQPQTNNDLTELEKLELSSIPPDLRPALGHSKEYFKNKKEALVLIDKKRNLIIGWTHVQKINNNCHCIELLVSPGWNHLYHQFLSVIVCDFIGAKGAYCNTPLQLTIKANDYITELCELLNKLGFVRTEVKELLVKTIWQKVKERKSKLANVGAPSIAPT
ncbi:MAG: GNAT family N-acetyltransferase [Candidatus Melainabacteria bacterium]|nr:GNAT family N-acetyltransferase [Candidatus Melainabacteria bacterium]